MIVTQLTYSSLNFSNPIDADLVFIFGKREMLSDKLIIDSVVSFFKNADSVFCSGSGEIVDVEIIDDDLIITAIKFNQKCFRTKLFNVEDFRTCYEAGQGIGDTLQYEGVKHVLLFADGSIVNGSDLISGITSAAPRSIGISGGLAGDGTNFEKTLVGLNSCVEQGNIVVIEFFGENIDITTSCNGGWKPFGPFRRITKSAGNVLYEIDHQPALKLYKNYLGSRANELPGSALLFPLSISDNDAETPVVRTILSISEEEMSMTFAGNMPLNSPVRLMMANKEDLIDAAGEAAAAAVSKKNNSGTTGVALLVSCVGRRLALGKRTEEELEAIKDKINSEVIITGFYSYGEISSNTIAEGCDLHNQTMSITIITEDE
jgi:hypothetical protein